MKHTLFLSLLLLSLICSKAQEFSGSAANSIVQGSTYVKLDDQTQEIEYIEFDQQLLKSSSSSPLEILSNALNLKNNYRLKEDKIFKDHGGQKHIKNKLLYNEIPVEGMIFNSHFKNGILKSANGNIISGDFGPIRNYLTENQAIVKAIESVNSKEFIWSNNKSRYPEATLVYLPIERNLILCYKVDAYSLKPLSREYIYVNAENGEIVKRISRIHVTDASGTATTLYSGTVTITTNNQDGSYTLEQEGRGMGIATYNLNNSQDYYSATNFTDDDNIWNNEADQAAYDAHYGTEKTYDYYLEKFNRNSIDDNGFALLSYVHFDYNYNNAFWDGEQMTYGDGDGIEYLPFTCIDIVGHEITHGLTSHTADLVYEYESGALNESFSDIFGTAIDFYTNPTTANYLIGEQANIYNIPFRSMEDPQSYGMPDTYMGNYWHIGSADNGGVHINSSVQNYWFYLLCEGGDGTNDRGDTYIVNSIGMSAAESIAYRTLTIYLTPYSDYYAARYYSIQSAIDLFGECSNEVIEVTNAWYAVGIGNQFDGAVRANFSSSQVYACQAPVSIDFNNYSTHAENFEWYINDNLISSEENPSYNFTTEGNYTVTLKAEGTGSCIGIDTLIREDYIFIANDGGPITPSATPSTLYPGDRGIVAFTLDNMNNGSEGAIMGYEDFTCYKRAMLTEGDSYHVLVSTLANEDVYIWLDTNGDGAFVDSTELIYTSYNSNFHYDDITIPRGSAYNTPIRLRVGSELAGYSVLSNGETVSRYGQYEDYTVYLSPNTNPPTADFTIDPSVALPGEVISFTDASNNLPDQWSWSFETGQPSSSTLQNPQVIFPDEGTKNIELIVTNSFGSDTIHKSIDVVNAINMGSQMSSNQPSGKLYDSGGPNGNYSNSENMSFLIQPNCAKSIQVTIEAFNTESCCDYLYIYDGNSTSSTLLREFRGNYSSLPITLNSSTGELYITFRSDGSVTGSGFEINWNSVEFGDGNPVIADFAEPDTAIPYMFDYRFEDQSQYEPYLWRWNFGDGSISSEQNPSHTYSQTGDFNVQLIVENCTSIDTVSKNITVDNAPQLTLSTDTIRISLISGETLNDSITINNGDGGQLMIKGEVETSYQKEISKIKTTEYFETEVYNYNNNEDLVLTGKQKIRLPIDADYTGLNVAYSGGDKYTYSYLDAELLASGARTIQITSSNYQTALDTINVMLFDDMSEWMTMDLGIITQWISNGGLAIINGDDALTFYQDLIIGSGIVPQGTNVSYGPATILSHPLTDSITSYTIGSSALASLIVTGDAEAIMLDSYNNVYAAGASYNNGKILFVCDEVFMQEYYTIQGNRQLFENALLWNGNNTSNWITVNEEWEAIENNSVGGLDFQINTADLLEGVYIADVKVSSNDQDYLATLIPIRLDLTGIENIEVNDNLYFPKTFVNLSDSINFTIHNTGTRPLDIDTIQFSDPDFNTDFEPVVIDPKKSVNIEISFSPSITQFYNDTVTIISSDPDQPELMLPIRGNAVQPPVLSIQDTIVENLQSFEISNRELIISNTGQSALSIDTIIIDQFTSNMSMVADSNHVDLTGHKITCIDGSNARTFVEKLWQYGASAQYNTYLDTTNLDADVIYYTGYYTLNTQWANFLRRWVEEGHGLYLDITYKNSTIEDLLEGTGISISNNYNSGGTTTDIADHPITYGIETYRNNYGYTITCENENDEIIKDSQGNVIVAAKSLGRGRIVVCNSNGQYEPTASTMRFGINSVRWLANKNSWLWVKDYPVDSIGIDESHAMNIRFDAAGLLEGQYNAQIKISSNDPYNSSSNINAQLNVTGIAISELMSDSLMFDDTFIGTSKLLTAEIHNIGTKNLEINQIQTSNANFEVFDTTYTIAPYDYISVDVTFSPQTIGKHDSYLTIESNASDGIDTLILSGNGYNPPVISVTPDSISLQKRLGEGASTKSILIDNSQGGYPLSYNISINYQDQIFNTGTELEILLDSLVSFGSIISNVIPNRFDFSGGTSGYYISDGGSDMYDGGNYLNTNNSTRLYYSDNQVQYSNAFGVGGKYFTTKLDGLFIMVADLNNISEFYTSGSLGADGYGDVNADVITMQKGATLFKGFIKRVYNSGDPSVNHLIIIENDENVTQSYSSTTGSDLHTISNLENVKRIHYLLFAASGSQFITNSQMETIMETYLDVIQTQSGWIRTQKDNGTIESGYSETLNLQIDASELPEGEYRAEVIINNNDPIRSQESTMVSLRVYDNLQPYLDNPIGNKIIYSTYNDVIDLNTVFADEDGDRLYFKVTSSDNNIIFPVLDNGSELRMSPLSNGIASIEVECTDNLWEPVYDHFDVLVQQNHLPVIDSTISNFEMSPALINKTFDLNTFFSDPDGDNLSYSLTQSEEGIVSYDMGGNYLIFNAEKDGSTIVTITATDPHNGSVSQSFIIKVISMSTTISNPESNQFKVVPNPVEDTFTIELKKLVAIENVTIISSEGVEMMVPYTCNQYNVEVNASSLSSGIYLVKMQMNDEIILIRFIKQ